MGSSPLTRGKPYIQTLAGQLSRLIPAHAGKTDALAPMTVLTRAHPRSRGENAKTPKRRTTRQGSSPLTRGKRGGGGGRCPIFVAHPRSRGENPVGMEGWPVATGSSPLTRGKHGRISEDAEGRRLIPAHAGKTQASSAPTPARQAHPRSRGENIRHTTVRFNASGSSPLTRGKPPDERGPMHIKGLIPAHAGKTLPDLRFYCADRSDLGNP